MTQPEACSFLPRDADGAPIFTEPWQAKAFALTVHLHDKGAFTWTEWSAALARHSTGSVPYFQAWVKALEYLLADRDLAEPARVESILRAGAEKARPKSRAPRKSSVKRQRCKRYFGPLAGYHARTLPC